MPKVTCPSCSARLFLKLTPEPSSRVIDRLPPEYEVSAPPAVEAMLDRLGPGRYTSRKLYDCYNWYVQHEGAPALGDRTLLKLLLRAGAYRWRDAQTRGLAIPHDRKPAGGDVRPTYRARLYAAENGRWRVEVDDVQGFAYSARETVLGQGFYTKLATHLGVKPNAFDVETEVVVGGQSRRTYRALFSADYDNKWKITVEGVEAFAFTSDSPYTSRPLRLKLASHLGVKPDSFDLEQEVVRAEWTRPTYRVTMLQEGPSTLLRFRFPDFGLAGVEIPHMDVTAHSELAKHLGVDPESFDLDETLERPYLDEAPPIPGIPMPQLPLGVSVETEATPPPWAQGGWTPAPQQPTYQPPFRYVADVRKDGQTWTATVRQVDGFTTTVTGPETCEAEIATALAAHLGVDRVEVVADVMFPVEEEAPAENAVAEEVDPSPWR